MGDTGFDSSCNAMEKTENRQGLYASLYARDADFARLVDSWLRMTIEDRRILVADAESRAVISAESVGETRKRFG